MQAARGTGVTRTAPVSRTEPVIISASRATDIPAWFGPWFLERLREGGTVWKNPFSGREQAVSFASVRAIVFWTKNPRPFFPALDEVDRSGIGYYFQFTLNDYTREGLEPNLPPLEDRIRTFIDLSRRIGRDRVIWRADPLILSAELTVDELLRRIGKIGNRIHYATRKLVFSFADIERYPKVRRRLANTTGGFREFTPDECIAFSQGLAALNNRWGLTLATCAEELPPGTDLSGFRISPNRCVDPALLSALYPEDPALLSFLSRDNGDAAGSPLKDRGQRKACGCIVAKDIGIYSTCMHLCRYCYANRDDNQVMRRFSTVLAGGV